VLAWTYLRAREREEKACDDWEGVGRAARASGIDGMASPLSGSTL
jgi:hypothetical protein